MSRVLDQIDDKAGLTATVAELTGTPPEQVSVRTVSSSGLTRGLSEAVRAKLDWEWDNKKNAATFVIYKLEADADKVQHDAGFLADRCPRYGFSGALILAKMPTWHAARLFISRGQDGRMSPLIEDLALAGSQLARSVRTRDLGQVAGSPAGPPTAVADAQEEELDTPALEEAELVASAAAAFEEAGLRLPSGLVRRFICSLLAKRFVILTGLSGSGKTKLAQALAQWITRRSHIGGFKVGDEIKSVSNKTYYVRAVEPGTVELWNDQDPKKATRTHVPRGLIAEWSAEMEKLPKEKRKGYRAIRENVAEYTKHDKQLNGLESHLWAAANSVNERGPELAASPAYALVPVGADWTNRDPILGYPDALDPSKYVSTEALELILRARDNPRLPHILILDEMNLSHVERYFADILSSMESGEPLVLHHGTDESPECVPQLDCLPANLFIIGTVNIDETTYMFSPKVLDRANVIEFRPDREDLLKFVNEPTPLALERIAGRGARYGRAFVDAAKSGLDLDPDCKETLTDELSIVLELLESYGAEFGYRTAMEVSRFIAFYMRSAPDSLRSGLDAQVLQKLMPRLHGSRRSLDPALRALAAYTHASRTIEDGRVLNKEQIRAEVRDAPAGERYAGLLLPDPPDGGPSVATAWMPLSFEKCVRMLKLLDRNGFASFAEA